MRAYRLHVVSGIVAGFNEAAGADPADAWWHAVANVDSVGSFNEAAGADPADACAGDQRSPSACWASMRPRGQTPRMPKEEIKAFDLASVLQ